MIFSRLKISQNISFLMKTTFIYFFIQTLTRTILIYERPPGFIDLIDVYFDGFLWDMYAWMILSLPLLTLSLFIPERFMERFNKSINSKILIYIFIFANLFIGFCELTFWNEFHSRFNFIAVDYLIYTNEVLANIRESYPMGSILLGLTSLSLILGYFINRVQFQHKKEAFLKNKTTFTLFGFLLPSVFILAVGPWLEYHDPEFHDDQLSRNGLVEFVRAFRSNRIDYKSFYSTLKDDDVDQFIASKQSSNTHSNSLVSHKKMNLVFITVESLGAKFIAPLGGQPDTTPYLNKLAENSIFFKNLYATGTRTVRGLEAINLSVPPTPGYAVVKRPDHKNLYSLGRTFKNNNYHPIFLYGGNGFFDNMNSFFEGNGFQTIDLNDFKKNEISFKNAWGACDEDLFIKAIQELDKREHEKDPTLLFMLTTSNHRPFTYPDGKIDIKSGESRAGAVKYTDFAIGNFLKQSEKKAWFKNTIFVIVADHSTEGRGQFDLEMNDFHIPMWIYAPGILQPQIVTKLGSQIDILPSLIQLLGLKDNSPFYGRSFFDKNWTEERAFIGNYQYVGYYKNKTITTLGPNKVVRNFSFDPDKKVQTELIDSTYVNEAISYYQSASSKLDRGTYRPSSP